MNACRGRFVTWNLYAQRTPVKQAEDFVEV